jgi:hypothetical protein
MISLPPSPSTQMGIGFYLLGMTPKIQMQLRLVNAHISGGWVLNATRGRWRIIFAERRGV